jgi:CbiX
LVVQNPTFISPNEETSFTNYRYFDFLPQDLWTSAKKPDQKMNSMWVWWQIIVVWVWLFLPYCSACFQWHRSPHFSGGGGSGLISRRKAVVAHQATTASANNNEKDLLDYFDPLQSPHSYPKGIDAAAVQAAVVAATTDDSEPTNSPTDVKDKEDAFATDPLGWGLSPPSGRTSTTASSSSPSSTLKKRTLKVIGLDIEPNNNELSTASLPTRDQSPSHEAVKPVVDVASVFDPTLSPHFYTKGAVPAVIVGDELPPPSSSSHDTADNEATTTGATTTKAAVKTVGILLIDHGSRNAASNERLHALANLYQEQNDQTNAHHQRRVQIVVQAAHMEIASPSIANGLATLTEQHNVDEIVCHPYFLSPGRHVTEDIPSLVAAAVQELGIAVPVRISPPVGSRTRLMMEAIHSLVQETSELLESD